MTATLQSYTTGTVAVTNGSDIVTLTGGTWLESWCVPGSDIRIAGESTAMVIEEWIDTTHVRLSIPIQRATAAGLVYSILMTSPAFGTNRLGALTAVERIRLMTENVVINQLLGVATGALASPALQDRIGIWDANDAFNAKPGTLQAALKAGTGVLAKSANYAVSVDDYGSLIAMSAGTGARTVTLPAAATAGTSFVIGVKKTDATANAVTIAAAGADKIDGAASLPLTVQYGTAILRCDGAAWHVLTHNDLKVSARSLLGLTPAADKFAYFTDANTAALATITAIARTFLASPDTGTARAAIGANDAGNLSAGTIPNTRLPARLGEISALGPIDYDDATNNGFFGGPGSGAVNGPPNSVNYGPFLVANRSSTSGMQLAGFGDDVAFPFSLIGRGWGNTGWTDWETFVRQSDFTYVSNANGSYYLLPGGIQICVVIFSGAATSSTRWDRNLPASFSTTDGMVVTGGEFQGASFTRRHDFSFNATTTTVSLYSDVATALAQPVRVAVLGRT